MAHVTLRFFGRFLHTRVGATGKIAVIAPRFDPDKFDAHQVVMSLRRSDLRLKLPSGNPATTLRPTLKVCDASVGIDGQLLVWNLTGCTIRYNETGEVSLPPGTLDRTEGALVLDLADLEAKQQRPGQTLKEEALTPTLADGHTAMVVHISSGQGNTLVDPLVGAYSFLTERDARDAVVPDQLTAEPGIPGKALSRQLAEMVESKVELTSGIGFLSLTLTTPGELGEGHQTFTIAVREGGTVGFSNTCPSLPHEGVDDLEFTQYYELLVTPPPAQDGLVPREPDDAGGLGEGSDCYLQAQIG